MRGDLLQLLLGALAALVLAGGVIAAREALHEEDHPVAVADAQGRLEHLVLHADPGAFDDVEHTYRDLLQALPDARISVAVRAPEDFDAFRARFPDPRPERFAPVVIGHPITTWSRDRYTLTRRADGRDTLLVPPQSPAPHPSRANDWLVPFELARQARPGAEVHILPFDFDGGDLIIGPRLAFADANLLRKNPARFSSPGGVADALRDVLGRDVLVLGERPEDVPHHHIGMYLTPLPSGAVAVGSPALALELLGGEEGEAFADLRRRLEEEGLPAPDLSDATRARFDGPAAQLERAGIRVVRLPLLPLEDQVTFITYNNGVTRAADDRATFLMPSYGVPALDQAAAGILQREGLHVAPIRVWSIFRYHGSVRCLVNVL